MFLLPRPRGETWPHSPFALFKRTKHHLSKATVSCRQKRLLLVCVVSTEVMRSSSSGIYGTSSLSSIGASGLIGAPTSLFLHSAGLALTAPSRGFDASCISTPESQSSGWASLERRSIQLLHDWFSAEILCLLMLSWHRGGTMCLPHDSPTTKPITCMVSFITRRSGKTRFENDHDKPRK